MSAEPTNSRHDDSDDKERAIDVDPGAAMKDPTDTDHPTGERQARENAETESPS